MSREGCISPLVKPLSDIMIMRKAKPRSAAPITTAVTAMPAKENAATHSCRVTRVAIQPPTSTPNALSIRFAVSAVFAIPSGVPKASPSATTE